MRNVFIIGPDKKIKLVLVYPMTTGRNFQEILRVIDSLQMTAKHRVATPADWKQGEDVIIAGSVTDDEAKTIYPQGWKSPKPYIRIVPQPKHDVVIASEAKHHLTGTQEWIASRAHPRIRAPAAPRNDARSVFGASQLATARPDVEETAVTMAPQEISTIATGQLQCRSSDSEVRSNVA